MNAFADYPECELHRDWQITGGCLLWVAMRGTPRRAAAFVSPAGLESVPSQMRAELFQNREKLAVENLRRLVIPVAKSIRRHCRKAQ